MVINRLAPYGTRLLGLWRQYGGDRRLWTHLDPVRATSANLSELTYGDYDFANGQIMDMRKGQVIQTIDPGKYVIVEQLSGGSVRVFTETPLDQINNPSLPGSQTVIQFTHSVMDREGNEYTFAPTAVSATKTDSQVFVRQEAERLSYRDVLIGEAGTEQRQQALLEGYHLATPEEVQERSVRAYLAKRESGAINDLLRIGYEREDGTILQGDNDADKYYELVGILAKDASVAPTAALRYTLGTY